MNADDYYGPTAFKLIYDFLIQNQASTAKASFAMVGYALSHTVTENGHVARGICEEDQQGYLVSVTERTWIEKVGEHARYSEDNGLSWHELSGDSTVSMNLWGLTQKFIDEAWQRLPKFLDETLKNDPAKGEYFLPSVVSALISEQKAAVKVLHSTDKWYGVTYQADKPQVKAALAQKIAEGCYPARLF
jgi:hypothetical protein